MCSMGEKQVDNDVWPQHKGFGDTRDSRLAGLSAFADVERLVLDGYLCLTRGGYFQAMRDDIACFDDWLFGTCIRMELS